jgi:peptidylprolyl isomerase
MKKTLILAAAIAALAAAAGAAPKPAAAPAKPAGPTAPGPADWRTPDPNDVMVIDTNKGQILVELTPEAAPLNAARVRELAHENFYDGLRFFRVIENFMDQTGDPLNSGEGGSSKPDVAGEFLFRRGADLPFALAADQSVAEVGFVKSLPVMSQSMMLSAMTKDQKVSAWGLFCPGVAGMARADNPDSRLT